jgi:hypothetical protein
MADRSSKQQKQRIKRMEEKFCPRAAAKRELDG